MKASEKVYDFLEAFIFDFFESLGNNKPFLEKRGGCI